MQTAKAMYADHGDEPFYGPGDYTPILEALGTVIYEKSTEDYQGDTFAIVQDAAGRVGFVSIGWGSCSGCDALQACQTYAEINELAAQIAASAIWHADKATARTWFEMRDWEAVHYDYASEDSTIRQFVAGALEALT